MAARAHVEQVAPLSSNWRRRVRCDAVCYGPALAGGGYWVGSVAVWQSCAWLFGVFLCMSLDFSASLSRGAQAILISEAKTVAAPPAKA